MARLLLLVPASTYRAEAFLQAAHKLHLDVTVGLERTAVLLERPQYEWLSLNFSEPARSLEAVVEYAREHPVDAVLGVDDNTAVLAAHFAAALGLPHNSIGSVAAARNKYLMRERLQAQGVRVPRFARYSIFDDPASLAHKMAFPCVIKPLVLSASCGVIRADDPQEFTAAFRRVAALLHTLGIAKANEPGRQVLVEDFVPGQEVALEGLMTNGTLQLLALFDKPDPLNGPYFEETIYVTPSRLPVSLQQEIKACAEQASRALGLREGPVHAELRTNDRGVWIIELAARSIGGRCSGTLRFAGGMSLEELILRHAVRMDLPSPEREVGAAGVMILPIPRAGILHEVHGREDALTVPGIEEVTITAHLGQELVPLPEGTRYLGFMIARGATPAGVEAALREAQRRLKFLIDSSADRQRGVQDRSACGLSIRF
jgi:biotin carboxylase